MATWQENLKSLEHVNYKVLTTTTTAAIMVVGKSQWFDVYLFDRHHKGFQKLEDALIELGKFPT